MTSEYFTGDYLANYLAPIVRAAGVGWALSFARIPLCGPLIGGYVASLAVGPEFLRVRSGGGRCRTTCAGAPQRSGIAGYVPEP
jgi:hypothetical protein